MTLLLKVSEVTPLIDMAQAIKITEDALLEQARGQVAVHAPYHLPVPDGALRVVSGVLLGSERMGIRFGPALGLTPPSGSRHHIAALYHIDGTLLSLVAYPFTTLRTGASLGVTAKHLAPAKVKTLALIGTGRNALALLQGVSAVRDIGEIRVFSRNSDGRKKFTEEASAKLGRSLQAVDDCQDAVSGADMVLTATSSRQPVFSPDWLKQGSLVASMGPIGELPPELFLTAERKIVSNLDQEKTPLYPSFLNDLVQKGKVRWDDIDELGDIIAGKTAAPKHDRGVTVFHESAGGAGDIIFANWCYEEARRLGVGQEVSF
jgi:ornithine cyclodeaminase/alanine dehydrogenase-like protein (mu-crystallin family)